MLKYLNIYTQILESIYLDNTEKEGGAGGG